MTWRKRYEAAHRQYQEKVYPSATRDFGHLPTQYPDVRKSNGLTRMITNFINWSGYRATRINTQGRLLEKTEVTEAGNKFYSKKWITGTTRRGTADISSTIRGRSVMWEIKAGKDKPSEAQLEEQQREIAAGGQYYFVYTAEEFFELYDKCLL